MQDNQYIGKGNTLSDVLAEHFDRPAHPPNILPDDINELVHRVFILGPLGPGYWIVLTPAQRRSAAEKWDRANTNQATFASSFVESVNNGRPISWRYWVKKMPIWTPAQAARLMCALDPDIFENLAGRANQRDHAGPTLEAKKIQRLAETQGIGSMSPAEWLAWADDIGEFKVHIGLRIEVDALLKSRATSHDRGLPIPSAVALPASATQSAPASEPGIPAAVPTMQPAAEATTSKPQQVAEGITKGQVLIAFEALVKPFDLRKALGNGTGVFGETAPGSARTQKGTRGGRCAALWNPVILAIGLMDKHGASLRHLKNSFSDHSFLRKWSDEWNAALDLLGE